MIKCPLHIFPFYYHQYGAKLDALGLWLCNILMRWHEKVTWKRDMEELPTLLTLYEGNALATGGFSTERTSNAELSSCVVVSLDIRFKSSGITAAVVVWRSCYVTVVFILVMMSNTFQLGVYCISMGTCSICGLISLSTAHIQSCHTEMLWNSIMCSHYLAEKFLECEWSRILIMQYLIDSPHVQRYRVSPPPTCERN